MRVWNLERGGPPLVFGRHTDDVLTLALMPDGGHVASTAHDGTLRVWEMETGRERRVISFDGYVIRSLAALPGGRLAAAGSDGTLTVWDAAAGCAVAHFTGDSPLEVCAAAPGRGLIVAGEESGRVHVLRLEGA